MERKSSPKEGKRAWKRAKSFQEVCDLMARFIQGKLQYSPLYCSPTVDGETLPLVPYLAGLNQAGFLTTDSQPGMERPDWKQRAFVDGFALESVARRIARISLFSDLHVVAVPPGYSAGFHTPVIVRDFMPHGWSGFSCFEELEHFADACSVEAMKELGLAWSISVIDLQWGREEHLWRELSREFCYSERPHPDLGLDFDYAI